MTGLWSHQPGAAIADIVAALRDHIGELCAELLPGGVRQGGEWRAGSLAGEAGNAVAVELFGPKQGLFVDHRTDEGGDALTLIAAVKFNGDIKGALGWARHWLGAPNQSRGRVWTAAPRVDPRPPTHGRAGASAFGEAHRANHGKTRLTGRLLIAEGIEDGLSYAVADPRYRVIAAVNLSNIANLVIPPAFKDVVIAAQNDPWWHEGLARPHPASRGLDRAIRSLSNQGKRVLIARSPRGKDVNDLLRGCG